MKTAGGATNTLQLNSHTLPQVGQTTNRFAVNQGYQYDKNGNSITEADNRSFVLNADNKQVEVKDGNNGGTIGLYY